MRETTYYEWFNNGSIWSDKPKLEMIQNTILNTLISKMLDSVAFYFNLKRSLARI